MPYLRGIDWIVLDCNSALYGWLPETPLQSDELHSGEWRTNKLIQIKNEHQLSTLVTSTREHDGRWTISVRTEQPSSRHPADALLPWIMHTYVVSIAISVARSITYTYLIENLNLGVK